MRWTLIILCLFLSAGCARRIYVPTVSTTRVVDTVVRTVADSAVIRALFECDSVGRVRLSELYEAHGEQAAGSFALDTTGRVEITTRWRTRIVDRIVERHDTTTMVEYRTVEKLVRHVPTIYRYCLYWSLLTVCILAATVVRVVRRSI